MTARTVRKSSYARLRARVGWVLTLGTLGVVGMLSVATAVSAPDYDAVASLTPRIYYINDTAGSEYEFTVENVGDTKSIGAIEIRRPNTLWKVDSCPTGPAGWLKTAAVNKCRYRSAATSSDDIKPGQSRTFSVEAKTVPGTMDHLGTWEIVVSNTNNFASPSLLKFARATGTGLTAKLHTFQLTRAVVSATSKTPGSACPAANKTAVAATSVTIVVCGHNRASVALTPTAGYSSLGGTFVGTPGTFLSGSIPANSGNVVLADWNATTVTSVPGSGKTVLASIGSASNRTSSLRTFLQYVATNTLPVANDDAYNVNEDTHLSVNAADGVLDNDTDAESNPLTAINASDPAHGTVTLNADGSFEYDPDLNFHGTDTFTYVANDSFGNSPPATVTVTVAPVNDAPVSHAVSQTVYEDEPIAVALDADDVDGDSLTFSIVDAPDHGSLGTVSGSSVTYTPDANYSGPDSFTYRASDGTADSNVSTVTITVNAVNDRPVASNDSYSTDEDNQLVVSAPGVLANDTDVEGSSLTTVNATEPANGTVTLNEDGSFTYTPDPNFNGTDSFTYKANDGTSVSATAATVTITVAPVDDVPVANDDAANVGEDSTGVTVNVLGNDTEGDGATLTVSAVDTTGTTGVVTNNGTDVTYDPNGMFESLSTGQTATDTFTYTVYDGTSTDTATVTITIEGANDAPVAVDDAASTDEASTVVVGVVTNDTDAEGSVTVTAIGTTGTDGTVTNNNDGTVTYDPNGLFEALGAGDDDTDTFTYTITDGNGVTDTATVTVTVNGLNDAPAAADDAANAGEDSTGITVNVLGNDTDADAGDTLVVSAVDTTGTTGSVTNNGTDVTYDPNGMFESLSTGQTATDTFTYTVFDGTAADTATVTITVTGVNDPPSAVDDSATTNEASTVVVGVVTNDTDAEGSVTVTAIGTTGTDGTVTNNNDGTVTYDPNGLFEALGAGDDDTDTFTYTITDGNGATDTATVTVTVTGLNDAPVANDDAANAAEDSTGIAVNVLGNDTDTDAGDTLVVSGIDTTGTTGSVTNNGTDVTYDPNGNFEFLDAGETATDTFTYTVYDGTTTDTATVTITVAGANDAPVGVDDAYQVVVDTALVVSAPGVLANDTDADDSLTAGNASDPANGSVTLNADGSFTYTPDSGYLGADSFTYDVSDGTVTDTATVNLTVAPPNDTPVANATSASGNEDGGAITVTLTGTDGDDDDLTFDVGTASNGLVSVPGTVDCTTTANTCTTTVTYTPNANVNGSDSFTYTVYDGTVDSAPATASISITAVNDAPSFTKGPDQVVLEDSGAQTVTGWATAVAAGPANESGQAVDFAVTTDNDSLFSALPIVTDGGDLSYTPAANLNGSATVTVSLSDDGGTANSGDNTSDSQTFTITVEAVNDVPSFTKGADETILEDAGAQSVSNWATAMSKGPGDESGQTLTFNVSNDNNALFSAQPAVSPTGTLTYTPAVNAVGTATVTVSLSDNGGALNGGDDTSDGQTFVITVNGVNDAPTFTTDGDQTVNEDSGAQTVNGFVNTTSPGPSDESAQTVTVAVVGNDNNPLFSVQPALTNGTLTYTPAANANGSAVVTVGASDDGGTANGGDNTSDTQTFTITVTAVNDAPSFTKGADQTVDEDAGVQSVSNWATAISKGPADESAQTLTFVIDSNDNPGLFSSAPTVSSTGTLQFTSAANKYGVANVTLHLEDNGGTANGGDDDSPTQSFVITVNAVNDAPVAAAKAFTVQANMKISLGGLLTGATDTADTSQEPGYTPTYTVGAVTPGAQCIGCTISNVNTANGTFDFDPPAGGTGTYTINYTIVDSGFPAPGATSAPAQITFTVNGPVVWFVNTTGSNGTGRLSEPFNNLASATTAYATHTNERIFVTGGNVTGNVTLQTDGWLLSDAVTGTNFDTVMGITPPAGTIARPAINGSTQRNLTGSVTLGDNSVVRGFDLTPGSAIPGLSGNGADGVTVNQMSITTNNARAISLISSSGTISLRKVDATGADRAIYLQNVNVSSGSFTVTGSGTAGSGGTITGSTSAGATDGGITMLTAKNVSLDRMVVTAGAGNGIYGSSVETFTIANSTVSNNGTSEGLDHSGINFDNLNGTSSMSAITVFGSREHNVIVENSSGTATLTVSNSTIRDNNTSVGGNGLYVNTTGSAVMNVTSTTNAFERNRIYGLALFGQSTGRMTATVTGGTYVQNTGTSLNIASNGSGGVGFTVTGGTVTGCATCGVPVNAFKGLNSTGTGSSAFSGTISGMNITANGNDFSTSLWVHGVGPGEARVAVLNNVITNAGQYGIHVLFGENSSGSQNAQVKVANNTVTTLASTGGPALIVEAGTLDNSDNAHICAEITANQLTTPSEPDVYLLIGMNSSSMRLPGYTGLPTDTTAVQNYVKANNPTVTNNVIADRATLSTGFAGLTPNTCTAP